MIDMAEGAGNATWLRSQKWYETKKGELSKDQTDRQACAFVGCGTAILRNGHDTVAEIKEYTSKKGTKSYFVKCSLKQYGGNYCHLVSWGDTPVSRIMASLELNDHVFVVGKEVTYPYQNRKGEKILITEVQVHMIIPLGHIEAIQDMYTNKNIQMLLNGNMPNIGSEDAESDGFESDSYDADDYDQESDFDPEEDEFEDADPMETPWR